jgi:antitoxin component YwqK of YwqJK toxin-antitoxin module
MKNKVGLFLTIFLFTFIALPAQKKFDGKKIKSVKEWRINGKKKTIDQVVVYNDNGKKIEEINYDNVGDQKTRIVFEYDEKGKCIKETHYDEFDKHEKTITWDFHENGRKKIQYTHLPNGKLKHTKEFEYILE